MATLSALLAGRLNCDQPEAQQQQQQQHIAEPSLDPTGEAQPSAAILSTLLAGTLTYVDLGLSFPDPAAAAAALLSSSSSSSSSGCFAGCVFFAAQGYTMYSSCTQPFDSTLHAGGSWLVAAVTGV
jgi:hypothetical protein